MLVTGGRNVNAFLSDLAQRTVRGMWFGDGQTLVFFPGSSQECGHITAWQGTYVMTLLTEQ